MTPTVLMIVGGVLFVIFSIICIFNFANMAKNMGKMVTEPDNAGSGFASHCKGMGLHAIFAGFATLSAFTFVGGLIWFLVFRFA
jgi:hypothetical protein